MFAFPLERWIPGFLLRDRNAYAVAKAIEAGMNRMNQIVEDGLACLLDVETMPVWRLDEMAWEYAADWYDSQASAAEKRRQIAGAIEFYTRLGTVYAVRSAVEATFGTGRVEEWFAYSGSPYHYRVFVDGSSMSASELQKLQKMVAKVQNLRSVLDQICYTGEAEGSAMLYAGAAAVGMQLQLAATAKEE